MIMSRPWEELMHLLPPNFLPNLTISCPLDFLRKNMHQATETPNSYVYQAVQVAC